MILHNQCSKSIIQPFIVTLMNFHTLICPIRISTLSYSSSNSSKCKQNGTMCSNYVSNKISKVYNNKFSNNKIYNTANKWLRKHNNYYNNIQMKLRILAVVEYPVALQYKVIVMVVILCYINHRCCKRFCNNQQLKPVLVVYSSSNVYLNNSSSNNYNKHNSDHQM